MKILLKILSYLNKYRRHIPPVIDGSIAMFSFLLPYAITGMDNLDLLTATFYVLIYLATLAGLKVYNNLWRFSSIVEFVHCLRASIIANVVFFVLSKVLGLLISNYVYVLAAAVSSLLSLAARVLFRKLLITQRNMHKDKKDSMINAMIVGAGQATSIILGEIFANREYNYAVTCIIDDDSSKIGRSIYSIPVTGNTNTIEKMAKQYRIDEIFISIPSLDNTNKKRITNLCAKTSCKVKILPDAKTLKAKGEKNLFREFRDIQIEDLLGREAITLDCQLTAEYVKDKVVLVTGGGGSIGSELCRQIASYSPRKLIILDNYENNAYIIQQELTRKFGRSLDLEVQIASVRDKIKLEQIFQGENIDIVFHAAAHKHVPLMEKNPEEAIKNNIIGTYYTASAADRYNVKKFVLISSDKAVNPANIMGATKRVCEMIVQSLNQHSETDFVAVRFGNVLNSNGSVIPLFMEQIKSGGPVTVTHKDITRYFMTIPEAVQLVLRATVIAKGGEIFVLDMGEPVKIKDLAYNLIRIAGLIPEEDIKIEYIGLRPGEKLFEELLITESTYQKNTDFDKIFIEQSTQINEFKLHDAILKLQTASYNMDLEEELKLLEDLVPEYKRTPNTKVKDEEANTNTEEEEPQKNIILGVKGIIDSL